VTEARLTDFQRRALSALGALPAGCHGPIRIASMMGLRPSLNYLLPVSRAMRAAEAAGLVSRIPPRDQWGHATFAMRAAGRRALQEDKPR